MTQSYPTYFHQFWSRKTLSKGESVDDFMEVTPAEKTALERHDATFVEPPQWFKERWNARYGGYGRYNESTGYFEPNGLKDVTYAQAIEIDRVGQKSAKDMAYAYFSEPIRTNIPPKRFISVQVYNRSFYNCSNIEVAAVTMMYNVQDDATFRGCPNLRKIIEFHGIRDSGITADAFSGCPNLEEITPFVFTALLKSETIVNLSSVGKLNLATFTSLVESKKPEWQERRVTLQVHADVYAKLTGDTTNAAAAALGDEEAAAWRQLLVDASEKNIIFTTT